MLITAYILIRTSLDLKFGIFDILIFIGILFYVIYKYVTWNFDFFRKLNIKYVQPTPFFGNLKNVILKKLTIYEAIQNVYKETNGEKYFGFFNLGMPILFISDPEVATNVLRTNFQNFTDRGMYLNEEIDPLSVNLFNLSGSQWKYVRNKLSPVFTSGKLKLMMPLIENSTERLTNYLMNKSGQVVECKNVFSKLTIDVIANCAFGVELNAFTDEETDFIKHTRKFFRIDKLRILPVFLTIFNPKLSKFLKIRGMPGDAQNFFLKVVKDMIQERQENNTEKNDFLQLIMHLREGKLIDDTKEKTESKLPNDDIKNVFSDNLVAAQCFVFIFAGHETTSTLLSYLFYSVAKDSSISNRLYKEVDDILSANNQKLSFDILKDFKYLDNVINETLRLYPPAPGLLRICTKNFTIPDTNITIKKDTSIGIPIYAIHRDAKYFDNPLEFDPDRFNKNIRTGTYLPFGDGPRICIGNRFALMETKLSVIEILRNFRVKINSRTIEPLKFEANSLLMEAKGGIWLEFIPRQVK